MHRKRVPRLQAFDYRGLHRYLLTAWTHGRRRVFLETTFAAHAIRHLRECAYRYSFDVFAYCFMPDHVHVLAGGTRDDADFKEFVRVWKQRIAFHAKRERGVKLWQRSFHEHVLRNDESTELAARYLGESGEGRAGDVSGRYPDLGSFVTTVRDLRDRTQEIRPRM